MSVPLIRQVATLLEPSMPNRSRNGNPLHCTIVTTGPNIGLRVDVFRNVITVDSINRTTVDHYETARDSKESNMQIICFEDELVRQLHPITHARAAYQITCASHRLLDWLRLLPGRLSVSVRGYLKEIQSLDEQLEAPAEDVLKEDLLLVNARLVPTVDLLRSLKGTCASGPSGVLLDEDGSVLVARIAAGEVGSAKAAEPKSDPMDSGDSFSPFRKTRGPSSKELLEPTGGGVLTASLEHAKTLPQLEMKDVQAFHWPHEVVAWHMREMPAAMAWRLERGGYTETDDGVFVAEGVSIGKYAAVDTSDGPILLDKGVKVGPFCMLAGPVYAGPGTKVIEHAALKDGVALGHTVKIGGEVEASVIEPYTNKQHHGFLGHSYLGSWINLGAGTCNSDLKNTYGKINIEYNGNKVSTGMQFLGCIIGDYSKTAINTSIFTGKVIGVCSMLYGFATTNVPSFMNYARLFGQQSLLPADVMVNTQRRMFSRRSVEQRPCDTQLIHDMYQLTNDERELSEQY
ncbi:MAG: putative sugar nucleotidyl transferase [Planctomycetota bacterium]